MKTKTVFLDTNVLLDYLLDRGTNSLYADQIFDLCVRGQIQCHIAAHSVVNMFYILRNHYPVSVRKQLLSSLCTLRYVEAIEESMIREILDGNREDIEDHLQILCAKKAGADCIVTRDKKGFTKAGIEVRTPADFLIEFSGE